MSHILRMATVGVMLAFAATGAAHARGNFDRGGFGTAFNDSHLGYAGLVRSQTQRELWPWYAPQQGVLGVSDMPSSTCSNDERIND